MMEDYGMSDTYPYDPYYKPPEPAKPIIASGLAMHQAEEIILGTTPAPVSPTPIVRSWAVIRFDHKNLTGELEMTFHNRQGAVSYKESLEVFRDTYPGSWAAKHRATYHLFKMEAPPVRAH